MKTRMITKSIKMEKRNKTSNKRPKKISTHQTGKMNLVTISSKIKTKLTKKTPP